MENINKNEEKKIEEIKKIRKNQINIILNDEDYDFLKKSAEKEQRSIIGQVRWLIIQSKPKLETAPAVPARLPMRTPAFYG